MNEREEHNRLKCCERCGEPPALCGCWSTDNDLIGRLRQQLAEKEQDFQVVKLAVIETEGRCAEFKAMLDDTLKQEFAVRQQLAEVRAEVERVTKRLEECYQHDESACKSNTELLRWIGELKTQLAAQAAELERLREELSEADWIIGSTNKQAGNHAEARHTLTPALRDSIHRYILKWHSTGSET